MAQMRKRRVSGVAIGALSRALLTGLLGLGLLLWPLRAQGEQRPPLQAQIFPDITTPFAQRILWAQFLVNVGLVEDGLRIYDHQN